MSQEFKDLVRSDVKYMVNGDFAEEITITPTGEDPVTVNGYTSVHSTGMDSVGLPIIEENAHCSFIEKDLNDLGITTRSGIKLIVKGWKCSFNVCGTVMRFRMSEIKPDKDLGVITAMLKHNE